MPAHPRALWALQSRASTIRVDTGAASDQVRTLALGMDALAQQCFRHQPARPVELEHAIEVTEELVMPLAPFVAGAGALTLQGAGAQRIAQGLASAGLPHVRLTREELEAVFNRLVACIEGRPATQERLPLDGPWVAAIVILREVLHHLHFSSVELDPAEVS